jgi:hypothetical protein
MPVAFRLFLTSVILMILANFRAAAHDRPNVIVILADDLGYGDVGCYQRLHSGKRDAITPSIDSLAQNGVLFTDFYAQPVCTPARWCLLTGKHLMRSADLRDIVVLDFDYPEQGLRRQETTLAEVFQQAGYATAAIGKWHLGSGEMVVNVPPEASMGSITFTAFWAGRSIIARTKSGAFSSTGSRTAPCCTRTMVAARTRIRITVDMRRN